MHEVVQAVQAAGAFFHRRVLSCRRKTAGPLLFYPKSLDSELTERATQRCPDIRVFSVVLAVSTYHDVCADFL